jgi:hypothetical protein
MGSSASGLAGADAKCQERAIVGLRPGTYKAWLSTGTGPDESPATGRFRQSAQPYRLVNGDLVASSWADLIDEGTNLANPIRVTELGGSPLPSGHAAWTNTTPAGTAGAKNGPDNCGAYPATIDCNNRESTEAGSGFETLTGSVGDVDQVDCNWTANTPGVCATPAFRLSCFQQA